MTGDSEISHSAGDHQSIELLSNRQSSFTRPRGIAVSEFSNFSEQIAIICDIVIVSNSVPSTKHSWHHFSAASGYHIEAQRPSVGRAGQSQRLSEFGKLGLAHILYGQTGIHIIAQRKERIRVGAAMSVIKN